MYSLIHALEPVLTGEDAEMQIVYSIADELLSEMGEIEQYDNLFDADEENYIMWMFENINGSWSGEIERELEWRQAESEDLKRETELDDYNLVFRTIKEVDAENWGAYDIHIAASGVDEGNKEVYFCNETAQILDNG